MSVVAAVKICKGVKILLVIKLGKSGDESDVKTNVSWLAVLNFEIEDGLISAVARDKSKNFEIRRGSGSVLYRIIIAAIIRMKSRSIIKDVNDQGTNCTLARQINNVATNNLSAIGSKNEPRAELCPG